MNDSPVRIVVAQRGYVFIGRWQNNGDEVVLTSARIIRRWGTSGGLAQLANDGPQQETILEPPCTVRIHPLAIVVAYDVTHPSWDGLCP